MVDCPRGSTGRRRSTRGGRGNVGAGPMLTPERTALKAARRRRVTRVSWGCRSRTVYVPPSPVEVYSGRRLWGAPVSGPSPSLPSHVLPWAAYSPLRKKYRSITSHNIIDRRGGPSLWRLGIPGVVEVRVYDDRFDSSRYYELERLRMRRARLHDQLVPVPAAPDLIQGGPLEVRVVPEHLGIQVLDVFIRHRRDLLDTAEALPYLHLDP